MTVNSSHGFVDTGVVREIRSVGDTTEESTRYGVEIIASDSCERCALVENCHGVGSVVWVNSTAELSVGQSVQLQLVPGTIMKATGWLYGLPLTAVVAGVLTGYLWLFSGSAESTRVLLSTATGLGMMLAVGTVMYRVNYRLHEPLTLLAKPTQ